MKKVKMTRKVDEENDEKGTIVDRDRKINIEKEERK